MSFSIFHLISFFLLCSTFLYQSSHAIKKSYIVYLGSHSHGPNPSASDLQSATNSHYNLLGSHLGSHEKAKESIFYSYNKHINGFAAVLEVEEATKLAKHPNVVSLFENKGHELQTTRSWEFLGLENNNGVVPKDSIWEKARYGDGTIIANIDTGVWPESKSFSDDGMGPVPSRWRGICQLDNFHCNRKLIGARFYSKGYESKFGRLNQSFYTARDLLGHGTPTLSIAGVTVVTGGGISGPKFGTVTNLAPWLFSVGASTIVTRFSIRFDRSFVSYLQLDDNKHIITGTSLSTGLPYEKFHSLISSVDAKAANPTIEDA
ncbi:hypothetical protein P8452_19850 [Trifolium repens]|nr:hypothetical protein P8452_19850 [Trifolium repens]